MPEQFINALLITEETLPCHLKVDYSDPMWLEEFNADPNGRRCAGALIMSANLRKRPRVPAPVVLPPDHETVFSRPVEFINHHRSGRAHSWQERPELRDHLRFFLGLGPLDEKKGKDNA